MVHYTAQLEGEDLDFDSSYIRKEPITFVVGKGMVIDGKTETNKFKLV